MKTTLSAIALALAFAVAVAATAPAIVAPKNCGYQKAKGKRWQIKADGVTCRWAEPRMVAYIKRGTEPRGWNCRRNPDSLQRYRCTKGTTKSIFAIKK